mmetsp:Transcript_9294/g.12001  ORF Transcript_9294/g.12001 Transcript_9294/m.12001 type:complete len:99 (+) Transcript_9294:386-682(+)
MSCGLQVEVVADGGILPPLERRHDELRKDGAGQLTEVRAVLRLAEAHQWTDSVLALDLRLFRPTFSRMLRLEPGRSTMHRTQMLIARRPTRGGPPFQT